LSAQIERNGGRQDENICCQIGQATDFLPMQAFGVGKGSFSRFMFKQLIFIYRNS